MSSFSLSASDLKSKCSLLFCSKVQPSYEGKSIEGEAGCVPQLAPLCNFHPLSITACHLQGCGGWRWSFGERCTLDRLSHTHACGQFSHKLSRTWWQLSPGGNLRRQEEEPDPEATCCEVTVLTTSTPCCPLRRLRWLFVQTTYGFPTLGIKCYWKLECIKALEKYFSMRIKKQQSKVRTNIRY